jgi:hypothetical protein
MSFHDLSICRYVKAITAIYICSFKQESGCMGRPRSPYFKQEWFVRILLPEYLQIENTGKKLFFLIFSCSASFRMSSEENVWTNPVTSVK